MITFKQAVDEEVGGYNGHFLNKRVTRLNTMRESQVLFYYRVWDII